MECRLPVELIQEVLLHITNDNSVDAAERSARLRSICLASQALYQLAAPHLYTTVVLPDPRRTRLFLAVSTNVSPGVGRRLRSHVRHLWCGTVSETLYDAPHPLASHVSLPAREVAWMQADSDGRYHGFHYSAVCPAQRGCTVSVNNCSQDATPIDPIVHVRTASLITMLHIVCPDLGRWVLPLFSSLAHHHLRHITVTLYPRGNWDLEASKIERILRGIIRACTHLETLQIVVGHTPAGMGSRMVRMSRSLPIAHAVRAIDDDRISVKAAPSSFGVYGRSPTDEVVQYTRSHWEDRVRGGTGPWPSEPACKGSGAMSAVSTAQ